MADAVPQNFSNHGRLDPPFHFFVLPVFAVTLIATIIHLVRRPGLHSAWLVVFMVAALVALFKIRLYSLKVQDRVIRLEERLRIERLAPALGTGAAALTEGQLIALRFASDAELPGMIEKCLKGNLPSKEIKKAVQSWRPDYWR